MNIKNKFKSSFAKSVLLIAGGTATAQLVNALASPIITRIYSAEEYGVMTVYTAILGMLAIAASLMYEWGIPIADNDEKAVNVLALCILVLTIFVGVITLVLIFFGESFLGLFNGTVLIKYRFLIPVGIFLAGLYNIIIQWSFRKKDFKAITRTKLSQSITQNVIMIGCGLIKIGPLGLLLGRILGQSGGITTLSRSLFKVRKELIGKVNKRDIAWCAKRYINFPLFSATSKFLNTAGIQLPVLFITSLYGNEVIGFYGLANGIVNMPMNLIGNSIADVFYGEVASFGRTDPGRIQSLSKKLLIKLILIGLVPLIVLSLFGPFLFSFVFGTEWYQAGVYSRIIAFLVFSRLIFTPISRVYSVFEKQKLQFLLDVFRVILVITVFAIAKFLVLSSYWAIGLYAIAMSIVYFTAFILAQKIISDEMKN